MRSRFCTIFVWGSGSIGSAVLVLFLAAVGWEQIWARILPLELECVGRTAGGGVLCRQKKTGRIWKSVWTPERRYLGRCVTIMPGDIPVPELLHFVADYTGSEVLTDPSQMLGRWHLTVPVEISDADASLVEALLERHGGLFNRVTLPGRRSAILFTSRRNGFALEPRQHRPDFSSRPSPPLSVPSEGFSMFVDPPGPI